MEGRCLGVRLDYGDGKTDGFVKELRAMRGQFPGIVLRDAYICYPSKPPSTKSSARRTLTVRPVHHLPVK